jgi:hypothetical protein
VGVATMCEAHVRVLYEIRCVLRDLQPTLRALREVQGSHFTVPRYASRRSTFEYVKNTQRLIEMCEELSELLSIIEPEPETTSTES